MEGRVVAEELRATAALQAAAASALGQSIRDAAQSYGLIHEAHERLVALVAVESYREVRELAEYLGFVREMLAELSVALVELHPDKAQFLEITAPLASVAWDGMRKRHLADWEAQTFRTVVVKALAGENPEDHER